MIRVIEQPSNGLFGLFNKKDAVVEVGAAGSETEDAAETAGDMTSAVAGAADGEEETVSRCGGAGGKRHGRRRYGRSSYGEKGKTRP